MPEREERFRRTSLSCYGNMFVRQQYYGSMELLAPTAEQTGPVQRKVGRFRVEPSRTRDMKQLPRSPSLAKLENPEFQCRWYFKFFLGVAHKNYVFLNPSKEAHALSVCITDTENHAIPQYRAILWRKHGCSRISFPYLPNQRVTPREVLRKFGINKVDRSLREIVSPDVQKEFLVLEEQEGSVYFKFGIIYAKIGQATDDEMFGNETGSEEFDDFLHVLGDTIELKGWEGYCGGLDEKDNMTGISSVYTIFEGHEVMFHVSVMLPYSKGVQQIERKRHIGNDIAVIVFVDGEPTEELAFKPSSIRTKFTHVFAVIRYSKISNDYWVSVFSEESVPVFGPPLPVPARFKNPQEFRSFLITKLMNGEKAAYASPVFNIKRQRTLESLIEGLQDEKWSKPDRFGIKRAVRITMEQGDKKKIFVETGQSLKVNMITLGRAPTSVANVGGLQALKNTPWNSVPVLTSNFTRGVICGDSFYDTLIVSSEDGIYHITDDSAKMIYDASMAAVQINVIENFGIVVMRLKKNGRIYVIPIQEMGTKLPFPQCRRQFSKYYLKRSKGAHLHALTSQESCTLVLAVAVGKRVSFYKWSGDRSSFEVEVACSGNISVGNFIKQEDFFTNGSPKSLTIIHNSLKNEIHLSLGFRSRFDLINVQTRGVSVLKNFVPYKKSKVVSALDVFDNQNPEVLLTYNHTSAFVPLQEGLSEIVVFHWNNAPSRIVCAFPFLLGFSENSIEIRLLVNGNLVHTLCVPGVKLITSKNDIFFTSSNCIVPTIDRVKNKVLGHRSFLKIKLSDMAGYNNMNAGGDGTDLGDFTKRSLPRNVGVYESVKRRDGYSFKRLDTGIRSFSSAAALSCPGKEKENRQDKDTPTKDISLTSSQKNISSLTHSSAELNSTECCSHASIDKSTGFSDSRAMSYDPSHTSFFYTTHNVVVHSEQLQHKDPHILPSRENLFSDRLTSRPGSAKSDFYDPSIQYGTSFRSKLDKSSAYSADCISSDPYKTTTIV